jgi:hypothetical protein
MSDLISVPLGIVDKKINAGTHITLIYENDSILSEAFLSYFEAGLKNHETCIMTYADERLEDDLKRSLEEKLGLERRIMDSNFISIHYKEFYFKGDEIAPEKVYETLDEKLNSVRDFSSIRTAGQMNWVRGDYFDMICNYEESLTERYNKDKILILCAYDARKLSTSQIIKMIQSHMLILFKEGDSWKLSETVERNISDQKIAELEKFTRFAIGRENRISELKKQIEDLKKCPEA